MSHEARNASNTIDKLDYVHIDAIERELSKNYLRKMEMLVDAVTRGLSVLVRIPSRLLNAVLPGRALRRKTRLRLQASGR
jgi:hypothetical protein